MFSSYSNFENDRNLSAKDQESILALSPLATNCLT